MLDSVQMPIVTLNQGQEAAADGFFEFLLSADKEMIISGAGGVGKTFLMGYLIDEVMPRYYKMCKLMGLKPEYDSVVMTATTNKAAEVLGLATNRPTETIHSFLNLKVVEDYSTGRTRLVKTNSWEVKSRMIVFVDECSMIDYYLRTMIHEGTQRCKIVYVGDHSQLAPVMETLSPIYRDNLPFYELTQPMRNADQPALMALCQQLRETVATGEFKPIQIVPGVIDWVDDAPMEYLIEQTFRKQTKQARILAYTNDRVLDYTNHIRNLRGLPEEYTIGEYLVNTNALRSGKHMLSVEESVEIIDQASLPEELELRDKSKIMVRRSKLRSGLGATYYNVPIPVDRVHYADLLKYYARSKQWAVYYELKNTVPDLRPHDAATVHKAQGSTYETVFLDLGNLSRCHNPDTAARLLYVGATRAKKNIILYGDLAEKYGGIQA